MACRLFGAKPLSKSLLSIGPLRTKVNEIIIEINTLFFPENGFENVVGQIVAILSRELRYFMEMVQT